MLKFHLITFFCTLFSIYSLSQTNLFWANYANYNPASIGVINRYEFSATAVFPKNSYSNKLVSSSFHVEPLHGAVGFSLITPLPKEEKYRMQLNLNYSFHIHLRKKALLAIGTSIGTDRMNQDFFKLKGEKIKNPFGAFILGYGFHFSYKGLNIGGATLFNPNHLHSFGLKAMSGSAYAEYKFTILENLDLIPAILITNSYEKNQQFSLRIVARNQYWIGGSFSVKGYGGLFGIKVGKHNLTLTYSLEVDNPYSSQYISSNDAKAMIINSINLRAFLVNKDEALGFRKKRLER